MGSWKCPDREISAFDLVALGFAAAVAQAVLLREAMGALGGSELAWGMVLGVWLGGMAAGAWLGARWPGSPGWLPVLVALLGTGGVVLLRAAPALLGRTSGEVGSTDSRALGVGGGGDTGGRGRWMGVCGAGRKAAGNPAPPVAPTVLESGGAVLGGLALTFLLAPARLRGGSLRDRRARRLRAARGVGGDGGSRWSRWCWGSGVAGPAELALARAGWRWAGHPGELAAWRNTRQQRLELSSGSPAALYADGRLLAVLPDPYRSSLRATPAGAAPPGPAAGAARGCRAGRPGPPAPAASRRAARRGGRGPGASRPAGRQPCRCPSAGRRRGAAAPGQWETRSGWCSVVGPGTLSSSPTATRSRCARTAPAPSSSCRPPPMPWLLRACWRCGWGWGTPTSLAPAAACWRCCTKPCGRRCRRFGRSLARRCGCWGAAVASAVEVTPEVLAGRWRDRSLTDEVFTPEMLPLLLDPDRAVSLQRFLDTAPAEVNSVARPRAVLLAAALQEGRTEGALLRWLGRVEQPSGAGRGRAHRGLGGVVAGRRGPAPHASGRRGRPRGPGVDGVVAAAAGGLAGDPRLGLRRGGSALGGVHGGPGGAGSGWVARRSASAAERAALGAAGGRRAIRRPGRGADPGVAAGHGAAAAGDGRGADGCRLPGPGGTARAWGPRAGRRAGVRCRRAGCGGWARWWWASWRCRSWGAVGGRWPWMPVGGRRQGPPCRRGRKAGGWGHDHLAAASPAGATRPARTRGSRSWAVTCAREHVAR